MTDQPRPPADFYDALAPDYHLLFGDWWEAARWHGAVVAELLARRGLTGGRLLDCTCGIGTQALPLAARGFSVAGRDVSAAAVARARVEASARGLRVDLAACDVRTLRDHVTGMFEAVISCDNALPHLLTDDDLAQALRSLHACLRPSGVLVVSLRDYDALRAARPDGVPLTLHGPAGRRHGSAQSWQWSADGEHVDIELVTLVEDGVGAWRGRSHATRYRALGRATLERLLASTGFTEVAWLAPEESGYYQPVVLARA